MIFAAVLFTGSSYAFEVGGARHYCKPPQFRKFSPPEKIKDQPFVEVEAESTISFVAMGSIDPSTFRVFAKKKVLEPIVVDKQSFYQVSAKLPAEIRSGYARIDIIAQAAKGECMGKDGWLIKIKEPVVEIEPAVSEPTATVEVVESNTSPASQAE